MKKIDKFHRHEVIDRCSMLCDVLDGQILGHPSLTLAMTAKVEKALDLIYSVSCIAAEDPCKKCGRTALAPMVTKKKKNKMVCLHCFSIQKRKKYE